jgi:AcrR family transcriptional regulator
VSTLEDATVKGDTSEERLESLADIVWSHYCRPEFLANVQIVMNLSRDPATAADTVEALNALSLRLTTSWQRLVDQVVEPERQPPGFSRALFYILRGVAVGEELLDSMIGTDAPVRPGRRRAERQVLLDALSAMLSNAQC